MNLFENIDVSNYKNLLSKDDESFMSYCPECGRETTFERSNTYNKRRSLIDVVKSSYLPDGISMSTSQIISNMFSTGRAENDFKLYIQEYECCVNRSHKNYDIYKICNDKIVKIGQYPSEIDNGNNEYLDKVKKICNSKEAREIVKYIRTALIMESYGYGIASLLYIRRAFEQLIVISEGKDRNDNTGIIMKDRIKNNKYLPDIIKGNAKVYNVISEGIHNQTEEECMELFKVIKAGVIILISKTYAHVEEEKTLEELGLTLSKL